MKLVKLVLLVTYLVPIGDEVLLLSCDDVVLEGIFDVDNTCVIVVGGFAGGTGSARALPIVIFRDAVGGDFV